MDTKGEWDAKNIVAGGSFSVHLFWKKMSKHIYTWLSAFELKPRFH